MSGSDSQQTGCSCPMTKCLQGDCKCFKAELRCSENCKCKDCQNTENNKAQVERIYKEGSLVPPNLEGCECLRYKCTRGRCACLKGGHGCTSKCKCQDCANPKGLGGANPSSPGVAPPPEGSPVPPKFKWCKCLRYKCTRGKCACLERGQGCTSKCKCQDCANPKGPVGANPSSPGVAPPPEVPADFKGCTCYYFKCASGRCACFLRSYKCTSKCVCQDCANPKGHSGIDTNTDPRQGDTGGVSNVPDDDTNNSIVGELAQMEEHATQSTDNRGSDPSKRPRLE